MKAVILCAGKGERLMPLTKNIPKPMIPINNKPVLEYLILLCKKHGADEIFINTSYLPEKIKEYFGDGKRWGVKITYSYETELLGTSGALNNFKKDLDSTFFLIYGDNVTDIDLTRMLKFHKKNHAIVTIALRKAKEINSLSGYASLSSIFQIEEFIEKPDDNKIKLFKSKPLWENSGIYVLEPEVLKYIKPEFSDFAKDIFPRLIIEQKNIFGFDIDNFYFREVGQIERYNNTKKEIEGGLKKIII